MAGRPRSADIVFPLLLSLAGIHPTGGLDGTRAGRGEKQGRFPPRYADGTLQPPAQRAALIVTEHNDDLGCRSGWITFRSLSPVPLPGCLALSLWMGSLSLPTLRIGFVALSIRGGRWTFPLWSGSLPERVAPARARTHAKTAAQKRTHATKNKK